MIGVEEMSEQIDWSKAPEGYPVWVEDLMHGEKSHGWHKESEGRWVDQLGRYWEKSAAERGNCRAHYRSEPTPSWSGKGLPPVGVVCEIIYGLSNEFTKQFNGKQVEIVAHSKDENYDTAVFKVIGFLYDGQARYHSLVASCFKPIRTHEQIAADEREAAINEMSRDSNFIGLPNRILLGGLYDAGYRKQ